MNGVILLVSVVVVNGLSGAVATAAPNGSAVGYAINRSENACLIALRRSCQNNSVGGFVIHHRHKSTIGKDSVKGDFGNNLVIEQLT